MPRRTISCTCANDRQGIRTLLLLPQISFAPHATTSHCDSISDSHLGFLMYILFGVFFSAGCQRAVFGLGFFANDLFRVSILASFGTTVFRICFFINSLFGFDLPASSGRTVFGACFFISILFGFDLPASGIRSVFGACAFTTSLLGLGITAGCHRSKSYQGSGLAHFASDSRGQRRSAWTTLGSHLACSEQVLHFALVHSHAAELRLVLSDGVGVHARFQPLIRVSGDAVKNMQMGRTCQLISSTRPSAHCLHWHLHMHIATQVPTRYLKSVNVPPQSLASSAASLSLRAAMNQTWKKQVCWIISSLSAIVLQHSCLSSYLHRRNKIHFRRARDTELCTTMQTGQAGMSAL